MTTGYSIELLFDEEFSAYVRRLWQGCSENRFCHYMHDIKGDVTPHIAMSVYENIAEDDITSLFERYKNVEEYKSSFESTAVCMFKETLVTYINVNVNRNMLNYFENVYHFFVDLADNCSPYYLPTLIIPHVSISRCQNMEEAKRCLCYTAGVFEHRKLTIEKIALFRLHFDDSHKLVQCDFMDAKELKA